MRIVVILLFVFLISCNKPTPCLVYIFCDPDLTTKEECRKVYEEAQKSCEELIRFENSGSYRGEKTGKFTRDQRDQTVIAEAFVKTIKRDYIYTFDYSPASLTGF